MSGEIMSMYGFEERDIEEVSDEYLDTLRPAPLLPRLWTDQEIDAPPKGLIKRQLREIAAARCVGTGLEVGALAAPFPTPVQCNTIYADYLDHAELLKTYTNEPAEFLVIPVLKTTFETLDGLSNDGLDFIVASHVIEHTTDPIGAIVNAWKKLRRGGKIVLAVPDKLKTWDRPRRLTDLEHIVADYKNPSRERDKLGYQEFISLAVDPSNSEYEGAWLQAWTESINIHHHTWTYESFNEMISWINDNAVPFADVWSHPTLPGDFDADEFYFVLTK